MPVAYFQFKAEWNNEKELYIKFYEIIIRDHYKIWIFKCEKIFTMPGETSEIF